MDSCRKFPDMWTDIPSLPAQKGFISVLAALSLLALLSITGFAIESGHILLERTRIQGATDAAALRGASLLYAQGSNTPDFSQSGPAVTNALSAVSLNETVGQSDVVSANAAYLQTLKPSASFNAAAIQVSMTKSVPLFFGGLLGISATSVTASSIAAVQMPTSISTNGTNLPLAISQCLVSQYWDTQNNQPAIDPSTNQPYQIQIGLNYQYNGQGGGGGDGGGNGFQGHGHNNGNGGGDGNNCISAQWAPLNGSNGDDSDSSDQQCINNGNQSAVAAGNSVYIQNGDKTNLYDLVNACSASGTGTCQYSTVPVVSSIQQGSSQNVQALACLDVLSASGGNNKSVTVQFANGCTPNGASGIGTSYGVVGPPKLVN